MPADEMYLESMTESEGDLDGKPDIFIVREVLSEKIRKINADKRKAEIIEAYRNPFKKK